MLDLHRCTYPNIESLEAIAGSSTKGHKLGTCVGDTDLEVAIGVLLLKNDADSLLDVDQKAARGRRTLLVVRHATRTLVQRILECRQAFWVVTMSKGLGGGHR